jgi:hypothetical protein
MLKVYAQCLVSDDLGEPLDFKHRGSGTRRSLWEMVQRCRLRWFGVREVIGGDEREGSLLPVHPPAGRILAQVRCPSVGEHRPDCSGRISHPRFSRRTPRPMRGLLIDRRLVAQRRHADERRTSRADQSRCLQRGCCRLARCCRLHRPSRTPDATSGRRRSPTGRAEATLRGLITGPWRERRENMPDRNRRHSAGRQSM